MIEAVNLTKRFDDITAVDHINAEIKEGSVFGLIGTNGAGKSTFLRLASGILKPATAAVLLVQTAFFLLLALPLRLWLFRRGAGRFAAL